MHSLVVHWLIIPQILLFAHVVAHRIVRPNDSRKGQSPVGRSRLPDSQSLPGRSKRQVRAWILKLNPGVTDVCGNSIMCSRGTICTAGQCQCPSGTTATASSCLPQATVGQSCYQSSQCLGQSVCTSQLCSCPPNSAYTGSASQCSIMTGNQGVPPGNYCGNSGQSVCGGGAVCQSQYCYCPAGTSAVNGVCVSVRPNYNYQNVVVPTQPVIKIPGDVCTANQLCTGGSYCYLGLCCCPADAVVQSGICVTVGVSGVLPAVPQVTGECFAESISCQITPECPMGAYCMDSRCCCAQGTMLTENACLQPGGPVPDTTPQSLRTTDSGQTNGPTRPIQPPSPPTPTIPFPTPPLETNPPTFPPTTDLPPTLPPLPPETQPPSPPLPPATIITPIPFPNTSPLPPLPTMPPFPPTESIPPPIDMGANCPGGVEPAGRCLGGLCPPGSACINDVCCSNRDGGGQGDTAGGPSPPAPLSTVIEGVTPVGRNNDNLGPITLPDGTVIQPFPNDNRGPGILDLDFSPDNYGPYETGNIDAISSFERNYYGLPSPQQTRQGGRILTTGLERGLYAATRARLDNADLAARILQQSTQSLAKFKSVAKGGQSGGGDEGAEYKPLVKVGQHCNSDWDCLGAGICAPKERTCACKKTDFQIGLYCLDSGMAKEIRNEERWRRRKPTETLGPHRPAAKISN